MPCCWLGLQGREAISELFHFELKTAWNDKTQLLPFDQLLGKKSHRGDLAE